QAKLDAATKTLGEFTCNDAGFTFSADPSVYSHDLDWPWGSWGCVRGYFQNLGTTRGSIQIWFTGPKGVEKQIVDLSNMDMTGMSSKNGYDGLIWNDYANSNQGPPYPGAPWTPTTQETFRYEDNVHVTAGAPVSCAQIGYGGGGSPGPTPAPVAPAAP